jgi:hypothetical protein
MDRLPSRLNVAENLEHALRLGFLDLVPEDAAWLIFQHTGF